SLTYGLTDALDVNVLQPVLWTHLAVPGNSAGIGTLGGGPEVKTVVHVALDEQAFGPGDTFLRTKYRFWQGPIAKAAAALTLRPPTGAEDDFQGLGDTILTPSLIASRAIGRHDVHAVVGVDVNADDLQRCRARYAVGASLQPWPWLELLIDVLGSS